MNLPHSFSWAVRQMRRGRKVRRRVWASGCCVRAPKPEYCRFVVMLGYLDGPPKAWQPYWEDFSAHDWMVAP